MSSVQSDMFVRGVFSQARLRLNRVSGRLVEEPEVIVNRAHEIYESWLPTMAYRDKPQHPLAMAFFICCVNLAAFLALREHGIDAHAFGRGLLNGFKRAQIPPEKPLSETALAQKRALFETAARASQDNPDSGEDVFEVISEDDIDYGMKITSCAICKKAAEHDAMDFVPYLCAVDDAMSEKRGTGLRRTGSIALGADHCDFRYKAGGEPHTLAAQYPQAIRV